MKSSRWEENATVVALAMCVLIALAMLVVEVQAQEELNNDAFRAGLLVSASSNQTPFGSEITETFAPPPSHWRTADQFQWQGRLLSQYDGQYRFEIYAAGKIEVTLGDVVLIEANTPRPQWIRSEPIELEQQYHPLRVELRTDRKEASELRIRWIGPGFGWEPIPATQFFHESNRQTSSLYLASRGAQLYRALRCDGCHHFAERPIDASAGPPPLAAPELRQVAVKDKDWLVTWLGQHGGSHDQSEENGSAAEVSARNRDFRFPTARSMPAFEMTKPEAKALAEYLYAQNAHATATSETPNDLSQLAQIGEQLFLSVGCVACHSHGNHETTGSVFGGSDLTDVGVKRTFEYLRAWLADPAKLNRQHRMPRFELDEQQQRQLAAFLVLPNRTQQSSVSARELADDDATIETQEDLPDGRKLFREFRCDACHQNAPTFETESQTPAPSAATTRLDAATDWSTGCVMSDKATALAIRKRAQPRYIVSTEADAALHAFVNQTSQNSALRPDDLTGWFENQQLVEHNCLGCHGRDRSSGIAPAVARLAAGSEGANRADDLIPPSLTQLGDKLHRDALLSVVAGEAEQLRPWLQVQMPRFRTGLSQREELADELIRLDRVPDASPVVNLVEERAEEPKVELSSGHQLAGGRLVTSDGFGCISCHQVGSVEPGKTAPGTKGPKLNEISRRIRRSWFDRFVRNPARIVAKLEMPSLQQPVRGVLDDDLDLQLTTLWKALNAPGFEPPEPNPVRTARQTGAAGTRALVLTDVLRADEATVIRPFHVGLANRHNQLFDLETGRLLRWSVGDLAQQRTQKKTWYWKAAGVPIFSETSSATAQADVTLVVDGKEYAPVRPGQFVADVDGWRHIPGGIEIAYRMRFEQPRMPSRVLHVKQTWVAIDEAPNSGVRRELTVRGLGNGEQLRLRVKPSEQWRRKDDTLVAPDGLSSIQVAGDALLDSRQDAVLEPAKQGRESATIRVDYKTRAAVDRFASLPLELTPNEPLEYESVPGFRVRRLSLPIQILPISIAWQQQAVEGKTRLVLGSLKGRVWSAFDSDDDGREDAVELLSDELASPYGLAAGNGYLDVLTKYGVVRLRDLDGDGFAEQSEMVASGWGHTDDYHDWAVGLVPDGAEGYLMALPCQQDRRDKAAARWRGRVLRLTPRVSTTDNPRRFDVVEFASGQRFPMGLARNRDGELFATDNQGNFNPFNELNHIRQGLHYGFINELEREPGYRPMLTRPAINIPHPWTRSVNGICFLESHDATAADFGPFEGHLIGCEYDTRRLIRMSLDRVNGNLQGATYPFSSHTGDGPTFLGPISVAVAPDGAVYVGNIRESGWGGANNIGEVVRLDFERTQLLCGIAEVTATPTGFLCKFTKQIDSDLASQLERYRIESYYRVSTPAYGGDDQDRRRESVERATVAPDRRSVEIKLSRFTPGRVYEIRLSALTTERFFPAEAYYTLTEIPQAE